MPGFCLTAIWESPCWHKNTILCLWNCIIFAVFVDSVKELGNFGEHATSNKVPKYNTRIFSFLCHIFFSSLKKCKTGINSYKQYLITSNVLKKIRQKNLVVSLPFISLLFSSFLSSWYNYIHYKKTPQAFFPLPFSFCFTPPPSCISLWPPSSRWQGTGSESISKPVCLSLPSSHPLESIYIHPWPPWCELFTVPLT